MSLNTENKERLLRKGKDGIVSMIEKLNEVEHSNHH